MEFAALRLGAKPEAAELDCDRIRPVGRDPTVGQRSRTIEEWARLIVVVRRADRGRLARKVLAVALVAMGPYAVLSYLTEQRIREVGIRTAQSARAADVTIATVLQG